MITVPAHFNDPQRKAVLNAAALARLPVLGLVEEPVAAALHYGVQKAVTDKIVLVYDFGGRHLRRHRAQHGRERRLRAGQDGAHGARGQGDRREDRRDGPRAVRPRPRAAPRHRRPHSPRAEARLGGAEDRAVPARAQVGAPAGAAGRPGGRGRDHGLALRSRDPRPRGADPGRDAALRRRGRPAAGRRAGRAARGRLLARAAGGGAAAGALLRAGPERPLPRAEPGGGLRRRAARGPAERRRRGLRDPARAARA